MVETTAAAGPIEKRITTGIRYANAGTICIASSTGVIARRTRAERPARMPTGIPTRRDRPTATSIRASVSMLSSQRPSSANDANADSVIRAARRPPKRSMSNTPAIVVPAQVSQSSSRSNHSTRCSIAELKPSKTVNTIDWSSWPRSVRSHTWKSSSFTESSFQTSRSGQGYSSPQAR